MNDGHTNLETWPYPGLFELFFSDIVKKTLVRGIKSTVSKVNTGVPQGVVQVLQYSLLMKLSYYLKLKSSNDYHDVNNAISKVNIYIENTDSQPQMLKLPLMSKFISFHS